MRMRRAFTKKGRILAFRKEGRPRCKTMQRSRFLLLISRTKGRGDLLACSRERSALSAGSMARYASGATNVKWRYGNRVRVAVSAHFAVSGSALSTKRAVRKSLKPVSDEKNESNPRMAQPFSFN